LAARTDSASVVLCKQNNAWYVGGSQPFTLTVPQELLGTHTIKVITGGKTISIAGTKMIVKWKAVGDIRSARIALYKIEK
jgi:hypothetical protein